MHDRLAVTGPRLTGHRRPDRTGPSAAARLGQAVHSEDRDLHRSVLFAFDPRLKLMTTVDEPDVSGSSWTAHVKGAPEEVLRRCRSIADGGVRELTDADRAKVSALVAQMASSGLRVLAVARRDAGPGQGVPADRAVMESDLCLLGLVALLDPPRPHVAEAMARAHAAGIIVHLVTGDNGLTAAEIARQVGIGGAGEGMTIISDGELDAMSEADLDRVLKSGSEIVFARSSPEAKLRIADALRAGGQVVAMTGDGDGGSESRPARDGRAVPVHRLGRRRDPQSAAAPPCPRLGRRNQGGEVIMKALVVYESMYGNTRLIADAVADGLRPDYDAEVLCAAQADAAAATDADLLVVGSPTHVHGMPRPATRTSAVEAALKPDSELDVEPDAEGRGVREWLGLLAPGDGTPAAAFYTRLSAPAIMTGRASAGIAKRLRHLGFTRVCEPGEFLVDKQNHLLADQIDHARRWGRQLAEAAGAAK